MGFSDSMAMGAGKSHQDWELGRMNPFPSEKQRLHCGVLAVQQLIPKGIWESRKRSRIPNFPQRLQVR